jgi:hypothetical protein
MFVTDPSSLSWTFLTNHLHVLLCLAKDPEIRQRDVALRVGITERSAGAIIADLEAAGCVEKKRIGRRNHYEIDRTVPLRHPLEAHHTVGELLDILALPDRVRS